MSDVDQWRATCFHEAAHAVFALKVCGFEVRHVSAKESVTAIRRRVLGGWSEHWRLATFTLAGSFAEDLEFEGEIRPEPFEEVLYAYEIESWESEENHSDISDLVEHLEDMGGNLEENYDLVVEDTERELRHLWPEIRAVAEALVQRGHLEGKELAALITLQQPVEER